MMRFILALSLAAATFTLTACNSVERTITGKPTLARPVEVVYRFENVRRTPSVDEWESIKRILYLHAKGSVTVVDSNQRRYDQTDLRDYTARFTVPDSSHIAKLNEEIDKLADEKVGGEHLHFAVSRAEVTFVSDNLSAPNEVILRAVATPGASVRLFPSGTPIETTADQYGAWAKRITVAPGQSEVYGYSETYATAGKPTTRKYFKINVFTMKQEEVSSAQFEARPKR